MNKLIQKAIEAIQAGKNDYAIGLLEGLLEMQTPQTPSYPYIPVPQPNGYKITSSNPNILTTIMTPITPEIKTDVIDNVIALERGIAGKIDALKAGIQNE